MVGFRRWNPRSLCCTYLHWSSCHSSPHFLLALQCLVLHGCTVWVSLQIVSTLCQSFWVSLVLSLQPRIWTRLFLITVTPSLIARWTLRENNLLLKPIRAEIQELIDKFLILIHVYPSVNLLHPCTLCLHAGLHHYLSSPLMLQQISGCLLLITQPKTLDSGIIAVYMTCVCVHVHYMSAKVWVCEREAELILKPFRWAINNSGDGTAIGMWFDSVYVESESTYH